MHSRAVSLIGLMALATLLVPNLAKADRRSFVWNYEAKTMPKGEAELEYYLTGSVKRPEGVEDDSVNFKHQVEVEYGITDNFDVSMYQVFEQDEGEDLKWAGYKVRGRYRFGDIGQYIVDPLIYLEFIHEPDEKVVEFEEKIVLSKNIADWIMTLNLTFEQKHEMAENKEEHEINPGFAFGYQFAPWITLGAEMVQKNEFEEGEGHHHSAFFAGPTISLASSRLYFNVGARFQATDNYDDEPRYEVRSLMGLFF